jgi:hypothetical protein
MARRLIIRTLGLSLAKYRRTKYVYLGGLA